MRGDLSRLRLDPGSGLSLAEQLRGRIALLVADGALRPGDALPAVRTLAGDLDVSVNTVRNAYARLEADGLVRTRHGAGTTVVAAAPEGPRTGSVQLGSNAVGVLIGGLDPFYLPLVRGVEEVAAEEGMLVLVADNQDSPDRAAATIRRLAARGVDGLIAVSVGGLDGVGAGQRAGPPIVYVDQPDRAGHVLVFDAERGGYLATKHLADHGHERIGLVSAPLTWANVGPLREGYVRALVEAGLEPSDDRIAQVLTFTLDSGRSGLGRLLEGPDPPTAVFAAGAQLALGTIDEARRRGVRVPEDLAVVGYTDLEAAELVQPPLTMVSVPAREIGLQAMRTLRRLIAGERVRPRRVVLDVELVVRSSCGPH